MTNPSASFEKFWQDHKAKNLNKTNTPYQYQLAKLSWQACERRMLAARLEMPSDIAVLDKRIELSKKYGSSAEGATFDFHIWILENLRLSPVDVTKLLPSVNDMFIKAMKIKEEMPNPAPLDDVKAFHAYLVEYISSVLGRSGE